ncbi:ATP-binding protein [Candidatus Bathyarchaeota archaeon]|nr:ATP-binding protein [Candidatus Bathyarchaeota archaeon]
MNAHFRGIDTPADKTCLWLFENGDFSRWLTGESRDQHHGLVMLKGKPGVGKSVLMKEAFRRTSAGRLPESLSPSCVAAYFFDAKASAVARSTVGLFRSLLYQLLPAHPEYFKVFCKKWAEKLAECDNSDDPEDFPLDTGQLIEAFREMLCQPLAKRTLIFVDGLNECEPASMRTIAYILRDMTHATHALNVQLDVCMSSRHFPAISLPSCPEIVAEQHNQPDIAWYVRQKLEHSVVDGTSRPRYLMQTIVKKCGGVFLWVVLVVEDVLRKWDNGMRVGGLVNHTSKIPKLLDDLFTQIMSSMGPEESEFAMKLLQWVILTRSPLRIREWHHIMAFIRNPTPLSLQDWRLSDDFTEDDEQLEKQIRSVSGGLVEVRFSVDDETDETLESVSIRAGAGSLSLGTGETRVVQVIHEPIRDFFVRDPGFERDGHLLIMSTCLDYLDITELDLLVQARVEAGRRHQPNHVDEDGATVESVESKKQESGISSSSEFERFIAASAPAPVTNIAQWLDAVDVNTGLVIQSELPQNAPELSTALGDYPALLSYATCMFFTHARLAEECGADASGVIERLSKPAVWDRWVVLSEEVSLGTTLKDYVVHHGLDSWAGKLADDGDINVRAGGGGVSKARIRRHISVESFSSASSHSHNAELSWRIQSSKDA